MINESFPDLINDFESCSGDWNGAVESKNVYLIWKKAHINSHIEVTDQDPQRSNIIASSITDDIDSLSNDDNDLLDNGDSKNYEW